VARDEEFLLICSAGSGLDEIELPGNSTRYIYRGRHTPWERYWFEKITLPKVIARYGPDVIYSPGTQGLIHPEVPQAIFIRNAFLFYDKKHYPDMFLKLRVRTAMLVSQMRKMLKSTQLVFCQTPVVKRRFSEFYHYPEDQVKVLGFPPPSEIKVDSGSQTPAVFNQGSGEFYILMLTCYMPHKNPGVLLPLCRRYGSLLREKKVKFITTVDPGDHPRAGAFLKEISQPPLNEMIVNVGPLSRKEVAAYMFASDLLWLPTLLECLATTYLEALALGLPILAPDLDFARYTCEDAAVYYDPWKQEEIFEKIIYLRENPVIREGLTMKGKQQLRNTDRFPRNWDEVAGTTLQELRTLAGKC